MQNRLLAGAYERWLELLEVAALERAAEERRTDIQWKAAKRLLWRSQSRAVDSWRAAAGESRRVHAVGRRALTRWRKTALSAAMGLWWRQAGDAKRTRRTMCAVVARWQRGVVSRAWNAWGDFVARQLAARAAEERRQLVATRAVARMRRRDFALAFGRWGKSVSIVKQERVAEQRRLNVLKRCARRLQCRAVAAAFARWAEEEERARTLRARCGAAVARWQKGKLHPCLVSWQQYTEEEARRRGVMTKVAARFTQRLVASALSRWGDLVLDAAEVARQARLLDKVLARLIWRALCAAWETWSSRSAELRGCRRRLTQMILRMQSRGLYAAFARWSEQAKTLARQACLVEKTLARIKNTRAAAALARWCSCVEVLQWQAQVLTRTLERMRNVAAAAAVERWAEFVSERRLVHERETRRKAVMQSIIARWQRRGLALSWAGWMLVLNVAADEQRRRDVAAKMLARWQRIALLQIWNNWVEWRMVQDRRRQLMARCVARIMKRVKAAALECWARRSSEAFAARNQQRAEQRNAHVVQSVLHKLLKNRVAAALFAWKGTVFRKRYLKYLSVKAIKVSARLARGVEMKCWAKWEEVLHRSRLMSAVSAKIRQRPLHMAFASWHERVLDSLHRQTHMLRVVLRMQVQAPRQPQAPSSLSHSETPPPLPRSTHTRSYRCTRSHCPPPATASCNRGA